MLCDILHCCRKLGDDCPPSPLYFLWSVHDADDVDDAADDAVDDDYADDADNYADDADYDDAADDDYADCADDADNDDGSHSRNRISQQYGADPETLGEVYRTL